MKRMFSVFVCLYSLNAFAYYNEDIPEQCGYVENDIIAMFIPHVHTCTPGYYLPANVDVCTICPQNSYCSGGTYTFDENIDQGIVACPSAHPYAPVGMWLSNQCGRKLHIGNDVMYVHQSSSNPTEHRLFMRVGENVYSANMVVRDMDTDSFPKMSVGASKGLHVMLNNVEYLVCDDSVCANK